MEYKIYTSLEEAKEDGNENVREDVYRLWQECFGDSISYTDFYFEWVVPYNRIFTLYKGDKLCSMLHLNPYTFEIWEVEVKADYIVGVATKAEERRKGYMGLLIKEALDAMYQEEKPFTYLMPAAESIYYPYEFRSVYFQEDWIRKMKQYGQNGKENTEIQVVKLGMSDLEERRILTEFTEELLKKYHKYYVLRSRKYYEKLLIEMESGQGSIAVIKKDGIPVGYAAYMLEDGLQIAECLYEPDFEKEVFQCLYQEFSSHLREKVEPFKPSIMIRIVNLKVFLEGLTASEEVALIIEAKDDRITCNNKKMLLTLNEDGGCVVDSEETPHLYGDIGDLTSLFYGQLGVQETKALIQSEKKEEVMKLLSKINLYKDVFINDVV
ncbi:GNAT family N-acetyltransferase [Anaerocolumna sp. AGMB13020]|uniref:GNAT family N-acetyltransferase n=1 Tax=Anaerocolumna sp. AGMB13020 TaxID=3081750 RepID=UPI0029531F54|nr:GNAT family N-acetyltransferase [Anaerocolumna sp. AGMB13020]WOO35386.1 GNAT family N-acetyltransferase [Anaerocolumna sp. AGMB13020]